jgi:molecular chaperone IbpA
MFDLTPLYRSSVGFDRMARLIDEAANFESNTYPPYNIERMSENDYRVTMAIAGFTPADINLEVKGNALTVTAKKPESAEIKSDFLHQGIAGRGFTRRFQLADHMTVTNATMNHGLLHVELKRELPEALKPRTIPIQSNSATTIAAKIAA